MNAPALLLAQARLLDTVGMTWREPVDILLAGGRVRWIGPSGVPPEEPGADDAMRIDVRGRTIIPGLIDAHVHVIAAEEDFVALGQTPPYLVAARAGRVLRDMLLRGFTTVRDAGGAETGLREAVAEGTFAGPRLFVSDLGLAQRGGQGDFRPAGAGALGCPACGGRRTLTRLVDGLEDVRRAVREMLRGGTDQIKVMASGGVASGIPIERLQFADAELAVMVDEAARAGTYVMAHAYKDEAVRRCVRLGIRSIEHASHLDDETCRMLAAADTFIVPTLSVYDAHAGADGAVGKLFSEMLSASLGSLERARAAGVAIGHGSDLSGPGHDRQSREFLLKARVLPTHDVLSAATVVNARLLGQEGILGVLAPGAMADLIVLDGDPLEDVGCLADPENCFRLIVKDGAIYKNTLPN